MSRKSLALIIGTLVIVVVVGILISQNSGSNSDNSTSTPVDQTTTTTSAPSETTNPNSTTTTTTSTTTTGTTTIPKPSGYTMAQVAAHNTASSCWTAINGNVYDVTSWINQHPGGRQAIISLCGTDGSAAFNGQHGGQRRPESELATFKIGALTN